MASKGAVHLYAVSGCLTDSLTLFSLLSFLKETIQNMYSAVANGISQKTPRISTASVAILPNKLILDTESQE